MPLNSLTQVNLLISFSSCYPCQIHCCSWMNTFMIWLSEQLSSANSVPSSWRNTLECQHHQTSCHLYLFHHLPVIDCILDVHLTTSWRCHWIASSSTAIMFLLENSKSSIVLYFLINLPLIFLLSLSLSLSLFLSESLFLVHQTLLCEVSRSCCSTSTSDIRPIRLTKLLLCYCSIKDLSEYVIPYVIPYYYKQLLRNYKNII